MAGSTEALGRLIAEQVLFNGERQLLRNRDQAGQQHTESPAAAQPASEPISHNDKAVAAVLRAVLDEQLDALSNRDTVSSDAAALLPRAAEGSFEQNRVAAQYAEEDAVFRPDLPRQQTDLPPNLNNQQVLLAAASPELRMAMQSAFFSAAVRAQSGKIEGASPRRQQRQSADGPGDAAALRVGAGIVGAACLVILLAAFFAH